MNADQFRILVVDDEEGLREGLQKALCLSGFSVEVAADAKEGLRKIDAGYFDLAFVDYMLPDLNGIEFVKRCESDEMDIVMITAHASVENAVTAMKLGAADYLIKPFVNDEIIQIARKYWKQKTKSVPDQKRHGKDDFICESKAMRSVVENVRLVARSPIPVLLEGESGTGKEMIARLIYQEGGFAGKPFVGINCAAIPSGLLESELFGHDKGSFSGAHQTKIGKFESAGDGILFLDEIGDMNIELQAKLLRVLEERSYERIGGLKAIPLRARVVSSTNVDLHKQVDSGSFRSDLYFRLKGIQIHIPPLREREEDIEALAHTFLDHYQSVYEKPGLELSAEALRKLKKYAWPGNVRELKYVVESAVLLAGSKDKILAEDLPVESVGASSTVNVHEIEKTNIINALVKSHFNRSLAAQSLQISRKTLYSKMKKYSIEA